jgi:hypothetical protein
LKAFGRAVDETAGAHVVVRKHGVSEIDAR